MNLTKNVTTASETEAFSVQTARGRPVASVVGVAIICATLAGPAAALTPIVTHSGGTDPLTEGFGFWPYNGAIAASSQPDGGNQVWQIQNSGNANLQAFYGQAGGIGPFLISSGASGLTQAEIDAINANGFTMTLDARIVQGPTYSPGGTFTIDESVAGFNGNRYDIQLGSDGAGNTLVILPTFTSFNASANFTSTPFGTPLLIAGTGYHQYQLSYDPVSGSATLYIDGVQRVTGYTGSAVAGGATQWNYGLVFGVANDGTGNFAGASLAAAMVPEPGSVALLLAGLACIGCAAGRRQVGRRLA